MRWTVTAALMFTALGCTKGEGAGGADNREVRAGAKGGAGTDATRAGAKGGAGTDEVRAGAKGGADAREVREPAGMSRAELAEFAAVTPDAGSALETFAGFSADEARFAWSAYSVGAGAHVLTVVPVSGDGSLKKILLEDETQKTAAQALLSEGGFSPTRRLPTAGEERVRVEMKGRTVRLSRGAEQLLYSGEPFGEGGLALPQNAQFWGLSPSGRVAVLETVSANHPEFGSARSFVFVPISIEEGSR